MLNFFAIAYILVIYLLLGIVLFFVIYRFKKKKDLLAPFLFAVSFIIIDLILFQFLMYKKVTLERSGIVFSEYPTKYRFSERRIRNLISDDAFNNFRPALFKKHTAFNSYSLESSFYKDSKIEAVYVKLDLYSGVSSLCEEMNNLNIREFIKYGFANIKKLSFADKILFQEILSAVNEGFTPRTDFYIQHIDIPRLSGELADYIGRDSHVLLVPNDDNEVLAKIENSFIALFDLVNEELYSYKDNDSTILTTKKDFSKTQAFYRFLYHELTAKEYLMFLFENKKRPGQIFVLLKDYYELINSKKDFGELLVYATFVSDNVLISMGTNAPIIQYYPNAFFLSKERIIANIQDTTKRSHNKLYLESENTNIEDNINPESASSFRYKILDYNPNMISLTYEVNNGGYLFYSDCYDSYWNAYVDDGKVKVYKANVAFKAIKIPAGSHKVVFRYDPRYFRISLWLYYFTFAICVFYLSIGAFKNLKKK